MGVELLAIALLWFSHCTVVCNAKAESHSKFRFDSHVSRCRINLEGYFYFLITNNRKLQSRCCYWQVFDWLWFFRP